MDQATDNIAKSLDIADIFQRLPHRYPFLLVDRVIDLVVNEHIKALKNVSINEQYFCGHFPGQPVMPGVLIIEGMAQAAGILAYVTNQVSSESSEIYYLAGIDNARFKRVVSPGDQLTFFVEQTRARRDIWKFTGTALVDDQVVCSADLLCAKKA